MRKTLVALIGCMIFMLAVGYGTAVASGYSPDIHSEISAVPATSSSQEEFSPQELAYSDDESDSYEESDDYDRDYLGYVGNDSQYDKLTEDQKKGLQTWYYWTAHNEEFFRNLAKSSAGEIDLLSLVDARPDSELVSGDSHHLQRGERFKEIGVVNDPSCQAAKKPDQYGLWLDVCDQDSESAGVMGMRKFDNPDFTPEAWNIEAYYQNPAKVEPPYRLGLSCGICHIAFNPNRPPADPANPKWDNVASAIGNQYIKEGGLFGNQIPEEDFRKQVINLQPRGTSDTSRIANDNIDNPNAINAIFNLDARLGVAEDEEMNDGKVEAVPHILKDGADSVGVALASLRVYVNIGMCSNYWLSLHDPVEGRRPQKPFEIKKAKAECEGWQQTEARMANAEEFLKTLKPFHLKDAPGGDAYLTQDESVLNRGKVLFADTCATCHSSKQPGNEVIGEDRVQWFRDAVLASDFLDDNFLSTDKRYPVTEIGTNAARALGTNATKGHIWEEFSSQTYKELSSPGRLTLENPFDEDKSIRFKVPDGGVGYYRVPSLVSIWTSAPFFHNNELGKFTNDPSVSGRMEAFNDAVEKLLWPETREGKIKRTDRDSTLTLHQPDGGDLAVDVPAGTPVKLLANLNRAEVPRILRRKLSRAPLVAAALERVVNKVPDQFLVPILLKLNQAPDFIEDHGHYFGTDLPDDDKFALIEFLKTL